MIISQRLKLTLPWLGIFAVAAYFAQSKYQGYVQNKQREEQNQVNAKAQEEEETAALVAKLHQLARQHEAEINWVSKLDDESQVRLTPVMSVELQDIWVNAAPILFIGTLMDIARNRDGSYQVLLKYAPLSGGSYLLRTELFLSARCSSEQAIPLLKTVKETYSPTVFGNVAIIGKVLGIRSKQARDSDGDDESQLTGFSTCNAVVQIDRHLPSEWNKEATSK